MSRKIVRSLGLLVLFLSVVRVADAQIGGKDLPDMSAVRSVFGGGETDSTATALAVEAAVASAVDENGIASSGIDVPDTGARGRMAAALAEGLGSSMNDPSATSALNAAFVQAVAEVESALPQMGFKKRDYGVAFALFFIMNWEIANDVELDPSASKEAGVKLVSAIRAASEGRDPIPDEQLDQQYDLFLTVPVAILTLVKSFEANGQDDAAMQIREFSGSAFQQAIGMSAYDIDITPEGDILGYW
ncbi:MAG: hypothetical protein KDD65_10450 [Bacteroidetes bacterium]|nr:hypothetical protein [Bacteroidota bacterium]